MRSLIDRYTLRDRFKVRMPFDGSVHPYEEVCRLIDTDFADYGQDITYESTMFVHAVKGIKWNHEQTTDADNLRVQLAKRVEQFRSVLSESKGVLFVIHTTSSRVGFDFELLEKALTKQYPTLNYHILVFNNTMNEYFRNTIINKTYVNIPWTPPAIYNSDMTMDFIIQMYNTDYGKEYSARVLKELCRILNEEYTTYTMKTDYNFSNELN